MKLSDNCCQCLTHAAHLIQVHKRVKYKIAIIRPASHLQAICKKPKSYTKFWIPVEYDTPRSLQALKVLGSWPELILVI